MFNVHLIAENYREWNFNFGRNEVNSLFTLGIQPKLDHSLESSSTQRANTSAFTQQLESHETAGKIAMHWIFNCLTKGYSFGIKKWKIELDPSLTRSDSVFHWKSLHQSDVDVALCKHKHKQIVLLFRYIVCSMFQYL